MEEQKDKQIEPICRFGPGGAYTSSWPGKPVELRGFFVTRIGRIIHFANEFLYAFVGCGFTLNQSVTEGGQIELSSLRKEKLKYGFGYNTGRKAHAPSITAVEGDSSFSEERMLFTDDGRIVFPAGHKSKHRVRAYRRTSKKGTSFGLSSQGTLFKSDLQSARTA